MPIKPKNFFENRKCCNCGSHETTQGFGSPRWHNHNCEKTGCSKWLCHKCYSKIQNRLPDSHASLIKFMRQCRTNGFSFERYMCRGCLGVETIAKTLELKNLNIEKDNFNFGVDLSKHDKYGNIEVKTSSQSYTLNLKPFWGFDIKNVQILEHKFDTIFLLCMDDNRPWKNVVMVYAIPFDEIVKHNHHINIYLSKTTDKWFNKFQIDRDIFNEAYQTLGLSCPYKKKNKK